MAARIERLAPPGRTTTTLRRLSAAPEGIELEPPSGAIVASRAGTETTQPDPLASLPPEGGADADLGPCRPLDRWHRMDVVTARMTEGVPDWAITGLGTEAWVDVDPVRALYSTSAMNQRWALRLISDALDREWDPLLWNECILYLERVAPRERIAALSRMFEIGNRDTTALLLRELTHSRSDRRMAALYVMLDALESVSGSLWLSRYARKSGDGTNAEAARLDFVRSLTQILQSLESWEQEKGNLRLLGHLRQRIETRTGPGSRSTDGVSPRSASPTTSVHSPK